MTVWSTARQAGGLGLTPLGFAAPCRPHASVTRVRAGCVSSRGHIRYSPERGCFDPHTCKASALLSNGTVKGVDAYKSYLFGRTNSRATSATHSVLYTVLAFQPQLGQRTWSQQYR